MKKIKKRKLLEMVVFNEEKLDKETLFDIQEKISEKTLNPGKELMVIIDSEKYRII
jgi:hypothetical protein